MSEKIIGPAIQFKQLCLNLGNTNILSDINFAVQPGEIHCLIGPNGGGKTSLIRCLLGQMPHSGSISVNWSLSNTGELHDTIGYIPQLLHLDKTLPLTVNDFMAISCQQYRPVFLWKNKNSLSLSEQALDRVQFPKSKRNRPLGSLSGGERQRLLFAQAMIPQPSLLVLDEPLSSLDETGAGRFIELIESFAKDGITVVWVAHELSLVKAMADSVSCINQSLLFTGKTADVLTDLRPDILFKEAQPAAQMPVQGEAI